MFISGIHEKYNLRRLIGIFLITIFLLTSGASANPEEEWNKTFGGTGNDGAQYVQQTSDGGYILAGYTFVSGANEDALLIKTDENGNEQWGKTFGGADNDRVYSVQQTSDEGFIFVGLSNFDGLVIKTDENGNEQWNKTFGGKGHDEFRSVQQTSDGGYILAGQTYTTESNNEEHKDSWLIKIDENGNQQWEKTLGRLISVLTVYPQREISEYVGHDEAYFVQQTSDNGYILAGRTQSTKGENYQLYVDALLIKTDINGNQQWDQIFGIDGEARSVQQTLDGGYILAGTEKISRVFDDAWIIKTDENGNEQWKKTFEVSKKNIAYSVKQTSDGGYVIAGYTYNGIFDAWIIKTDEDGNEQWRKTFEGSKQDTVYSVQPTSDNGYILAGYTSSYGAGLNDAWLIKMSGELIETTEAPIITPTETTETNETPTEVAEVTEVAEINETPKTSPTTSATEESPGFEVVLGIITILSISVLMRKKR
ncbi:MAG: hypothetical protein KAR20_01970 [Candidatus Heimdallarchaeota archaeon]|nr:hypothetical protein [Candidatus Heimdallarchaeota archaeon]